jgi:hypothetical protein
MSVDDVQYLAVQQMKSAADALARLSRGNPSHEWMKPRLVNELRAITAGIESLIRQAEAAPTEASR